MVAAKKKRKAKAKPRKRAAKKKRVVVKRRPGRKSKFTKKLADSLCRWLEGGYVMAQWLIDNDIGRRTVQRWVEEDREGFATDFARAKDAGFDAIAEDVLTIIDTPMFGVTTTCDEDGEKTVTADMLGHRKARAEFRLKLLAKWDPKRYGDKVAIDHSGKVDLETLIVEAAKRVEDEDE